MRTFIFISLLCLFKLSSAICQDSDYTLLWKIESQDHKENSYLFGTMHVQDQRAFNFSDSVMLAIEECHQFALEIHPDTMVSAAYREFFTPDTTNYYKELMSEERYQDFLERYEKENGTSFEDLESKNPLLVDATNDVDKSAVFSKDKQTFVDMYLYGIAETLNKKTLGLESVENQIESIKLDAIINEAFYFEYDTTESQNKSNTLADSYQSGNIADMEAILSSRYAESEIMIRRNKEMTESLDSLINVSSTFAAVGAAHLMGKKSIIKLLEEKGYKLSPVTATFTGVADNYKIDANKGAWHNYHDETGAYFVSFPRTALDYSQLYPYDATDSIYIKTLIHTDLLTMKNYLFTYNDFPIGYYLDSPNTVYSEFEDEMKMMGTIIEGPTDTIVDNVNGKQYIVKIENEGHVIVRLFVKGNRTYKIIYHDMNLVDPEKLDYKFINSLHFTKNKASIATVENNNELYNYPRFEKIKIEKDSQLDYSYYIKDQYSISTNNPATGGCYLTEKSHIRPYYKIESLDSFYNFTSDYLLGWNDSILLKKDIYINDSLGRELIISDNYNKTFKRIKYWVDKDAILMQSFYGDTTEIYSETADAFFNVNPHTEIKSAFDLYASKSNLILADIESTDTIKQQKAKAAFDYYYFKKEDIPALKKTLTKHLSSDSLSSGIPFKIITEFMTLEDSSITTYLKDLYINGNPSNVLKVQILTAFNSLGDYDSFTSSLFEDPPTSTKQNYYLAEPFRDSTALFHDNFYKYLEISKHYDLRSDFLSLALTSFESDTLRFKKQIEDNYSALFRYWETDLDSFKTKMARGDSDYYYDIMISNYLDLVRSHQNEAHIPLINQLSLVDTGGMFTYEIALAKIVNNLTYEHAYIDSLLQSPEAYSVIDAYVKGRQHESLNDTLVDYKNILKAKLAQTLYYYEDSETFDVLKLKEVKHNGKSYMTYKFEYEYYYDANEKELAYAIVGPYTRQDILKELNSLESSFYYFDEDEDFYGKIEEHIEKFEE